MGTRVAPSFDNIHMGKYEDDHVYTYHLQPFIYFAISGWHYIFFIWQHGHEELNKFVDHLNSRMESMKFTMEVSREEMSFLDTTVILRDRTLHTDFFCTPTDSHSYLQYSSALPLQEKYPLQSVPMDQKDL